MIDWIGGRPYTHTYTHICIYESMMLMWPYYILHNITIYIERESERNTLRFAYISKISFFKNFSVFFFPLRKLKLFRLFSNNYSTFFRLPKVPAGKYGIFESGNHIRAMPLFRFLYFFHFPLIK